jgi:hypothetical protein
VLQCENASLAYARHFSGKGAQDQAAKATKTQGGSAPQKTLVSKPLTSNTPQTPMGTTSQKGINTALASAHPLINQKADNKNKGLAEDENSKEILANPNDPEKKLKISPKLNPK